MTKKKHGIGTIKSGGVAYFNAKDLQLWFTAVAEECEAGLAGDAPHILRSVRDAMMDLADGN